MMPLLFKSERMDSMPKKIDPQLRARCVRLVREHQQEYPSQFAAVVAVARQEGVSKESVRRWLAQADVDDGHAEGLSTDERKELVELRRKNRVLEMENEILKRASAYFARENVLPK